VANAALTRCTGGRCWPEGPALPTAPSVGTDPTGRAYGDLLSVGDADELVTSRGLRHPHLRVVRDGDPVAQREYTTRRTVGGRTFDDLIEPARALDAFRRGGTLVFQSLHTFWEPLGAFCRALTAELGRATQANAYLSPHEARGLDVHYDTHDVFALQVSGSKEWEVYQPVFPDPLADQHWGAVRAQGDPVHPEPDDPPLVVTLRPGESLFVPRGFVHRARTTSEASLHITIGVHARTWHTALSRLVERAAREPAFRAAMPIGVGPPDLDAFRRTLHRWIDEQDLADLVASDDPAPQRTGTAGYNKGVLGDLVRPITDATVVAHRHPLVDLRLDPEPAAKRSGDAANIALHTPDRVLRLPVRARPALLTVLAGDRLTVADLAPHLDRDSRLVLVRRLVAEGVLRITPVDR